MNPSVLQALIASGMLPADASRLATSMDAAYRKSGPPPISPSAAINAEPSINSAQLFASGPAGLIGNGPYYGKGNAALGVDGLAYVDGEIYSSGTLHASEARLRGPIASSGYISGRAGLFTSLGIPGAADIDSRRAAFGAPLVAANGLVSSKGGQFAGDNTFLGPVTISGRMFWGGERRPANVQVLTFASAGNNQVFLRRSNVAVLNDYGDAAPGVLTYSLPVLPVAKTFLTDLSATSSYVVCNNITEATLNASLISCVTQVQTSAVSVVTEASSGGVSVVTELITNPQTVVTQVLTSGISVLTAVTFDASNCAITQTGTTVYGVVTVNDTAVNQVTSVAGATVQQIKIFSGKTINAVSTVGATQIYGATTPNISLASAATTASYFAPYSITCTSLMGVYALTGLSISIQAS